MRYGSPEAFRTALEQRLKNDAEASGVALTRLRKRVAFERLLARLASTPTRDWMLKGAFALELRLGLRTRATKDVDLALPAEEDDAIEYLNSAAALDLGDYFQFEVRRTPALDTASEIRAVRFTVRADLAGRRFEQFPVDMALSESSPVETEQLSVPNSLEFAGLSLPAVPVVGLERHVAEKLHAYTGRYGPSGRESTRVKDLVDIVLIAELTELDASRLAASLKTTFDQRASQPLPQSVPTPPDSWARPYAQLAREVGLEADLQAAHTAAAQLFDPVLRSEANRRDIHAIDAKKHE